MATTHLTQAVEQVGGFGTKTSTRRTALRPSHRLEVEYPTGRVNRPLTYMREPASDGQP